MTRILSVVFMVFVLSSCTQGTSQQPDIFDEASSKAEAACASLKHTLGKPLVSWVRCYDRELRKSYEEIGQSISEGHNLELLKMKALAPEVDKGRLSMEQYQFEIQNYHQQLLEQDQAMRVRNLQAYRLIYGF